MTPPAKPAGPARPARHKFMQAMIVADLVIACGVATQYVAWRFRFHPNLGPIWFVANPLALWEWRTAAVVLGGFGFVTATRRRTRRFALLLALAGCAAGWVAWGSTGRVYAPHHFLIWAVAYRHIVPLAPIMQAGWIAWGIAWGVLLLATLGAVTSSRTLATPSGAHGTAAWGTGAEFRTSYGLAFGRDERQHLLRYAGDGHLLTVAPTRSGKGVSVVIPTLLTARTAAVVTDPKGENFAVTARARREMGQRVHALDPFQVAQGTARLNPLDAIDLMSPTAHDEAWGLADMLVVTDQALSGAGEFWNEEARAFLAGLILHVLASAPPELRHLPRVRELMTLPAEPFAALLAEMQQSPAAFGLVSRAASRLLQKEERERSGVISSVQNHTHFLDSPAIRHVLTESTFSFRDLVSGDATCYLILPPTHLRTYKRWMRLMIGGALQPLTDPRAGTRRDVSSFCSTSSPISAASGWWRTACRSPADMAPPSG